ncbi:phasin family protein [Marinovum sp.]|uniref:phasin family protein n=1 Tax=Marinovum sp. TaxID=2024839 RepID=UPI002B266163|nr:phasin family protein [Marinovum sp.]
MAAAKAQDVTALLKDMMGAFPVDTSALEDAFKTQATLNEKLSNVALEAAEKSTEISSKWTKDTLAKLADLSKAKSEPADYAKAMTDFASAQAEVAAENVAAFAEIAKKVQMETVELMMAAGKEFSEEASAAVKKATNDATAATKKATSTATAK